MNNYYRICTQKEHEKYQASHLCVLKDCKIQQKWCCTSCITQQIHLHGQQKLDHIIPWDKFIKQKQEEIIKFQQQNSYDNLELLSRGLQQCRQLFKILQEYQQLIQKQIQIIQEDHVIFNKTIYDLNEENFIRLDDERINELLYFDSNKLFINKSKILIKQVYKIDQKLIEFDTIIKEYQKYSIDKNNNSDISQLKYKITHIDETNSNFNASQISNNEGYLAYGGDDCILKIYDIRKDKVIKQIKVDSYIYACQFTIDSSLFFVGSYKGYVYGFDVLNNFKQISKQQIHKKQVCNIRTILNQYFITCSYDRTIIKTNISMKQEIFKLTHTEIINAIEYNDQENMIISASQDKSIILWDCNVQSKIINKEQSKQVRQIQFINNYQNLLSLDSSNNLYKWKIDLINKDLIKIKEIFNPHQIFNFYQINQDQNILLICKQYVRIINEQGENVNLIDCLAEELDSGIMDSQQLDNGKFIQIRTNQKLQLAQALNFHN